MLSEREIYLINADIDGELGAGEKDELDAILESSLEARAMRSELQRLANLLDAVPAAQPPPKLAGRILDTLAPEPKRARFLMDLLTPFRPVPVGLAFAAGLLLSISMYHGEDSAVRITDTENLTGTMLARPGEPGTPLDSFVLREPGLSGVVALRSGQDEWVLEIDLESTGPTEITIALESAGLGFGGISVAKPKSAEMAGFYEFANGTLRVVSESMQTLSVRMPVVSAKSAGDREIRIDLSAGETRQYSGFLRG